MERTSAMLLRTAIIAFLSRIYWELSQCLQIKAPSREQFKIIKHARTKKRLRLKLNTCNKACVHLWRYLFLW